MPPQYRHVLRLGEGQELRPLVQMAGALDPPRLQHAHLRAGEVDCVTEEGWGEGVC